MPSICSIMVLVTSASVLQLSSRRNVGVAAAAFAPLENRRRLKNAPLHLHSHLHSYLHTTSRMNYKNEKVSRDGRSSFLFQRANVNGNEKPSSSTNLAMTSDDTNNDNNDNNEYQNKNNINDQIFSAISGNGEMKVTVTTIRNIVNDSMIQQSLTKTPADALARSMTCGLLLSNGMQTEQSFQLTLKCDGPIRNVVSISTADGTVKGYVGNPSLGDMHISEAVGKGTIQVVKNHPEWPNPYNGITAMEHGDVDRDVGIYLAESEQRSCALAAATKINGILCVAAGGYVVEQLPFCSKETVEQVEKNLERIVQENGSEHAVPAGLLLNGATPFDICSTILDGLEMKPLDQLTPKLVCGCSADQLFRAVRLLPREEIDKILEEEEQIEARCHFCGTVYRMEPEEVKERFATATGDPSLDSDFQGNK